MGTGEERTPPKPSKAASSTQEMPMTPSYPDWSSSMQAYYGAGTPPPFFASSPSPHPYMWGAQHPLISPYGTPVPYPAMYPPGGIYAHPTMPMAPSSAQPTKELEEKGNGGKDRASTKKSKGNSGAKGEESGKAASDSGNDGASQSAESDSEGPSDGSDENTNQQDFASSRKGSFDQMLADANAQSNHGAGAIQGSVTGKPVVSMPATNLNIGMELWTPSSAAAGGVKMCAASTIAPASMPEQWIPDERELKKQKRKQSNRESARRSRLRKQAECEELQARVEKLNGENRNLREEMQRLAEECGKLTSENISIKDELVRLCGADTVATLEQNITDSILHPRGADESN